MGTRHHIVVTDKDGVTKVRQYAQWDGYFEGVGLEMLGMISLPGFLGALESKLGIVKPLPAGNPELPEMPLYAELSSLPKDLRDWIYSFAHRDLSYRVLENIVKSNASEILLVKDRDIHQEYSYHIDYGDLTWTATRHRASKNDALTYPLDKLPSADQFMLDALMDEKDSTYLFDLEKRQIISNCGDEVFRRSF